MKYWQHEDTGSVCEKSYQPSPRWYEISQDAYIVREAIYFISELKARAYGIPDAGNELEGDFGTWDNWRDALVEFARRVISPII